MNSLNRATATGRRHTATASIVLCTAILLPACEGRASLPLPAAPGTPTPPAAATFTLSGVVSETLAGGPVPVEAARVLDVAAGRVSLTDANGRYSIADLSGPTSRSISTGKEGYITTTQTVQMSGDTQVDIRLERVQTSILSGVVFEITAAGRIPIEGVELYCDSCGSPVGHTFVYTDAKGFYSFAWTLNGVHPLFVRKPGYAIFDPTGTLIDALGRINAGVNGDTTFDIQMVRH